MKLKREREYALNRNYYVLSLLFQIHIVFNNKNTNATTIQEFPLFCFGHYYGHWLIINEGTNKVQVENEGTQYKNPLYTYMHMKIVV